jgi:hypothetical protein
MTSPRLEWRPIDTAEKYRDNPVLLSDGNQVAPAIWEPWGKAGEGFWNFLDPEAILRRPIGCRFLARRRTRTAGIRRDGRAQVAGRRRQAG